MRRDTGTSTKNTVGLGARLARAWDLRGVLALIGIGAGSGAYTLLGI